MIRVRFHGRGGHGVKTASRIVGTAAFQAGQYIQDSPIYGAERRGAAIAAFTRISPHPILERGVISRPDLIVIGDETLLENPAAGVLGGQDSARAIFINAEDASHLVAEHHIQPRTVVMDVTALTVDKLGKASALSAGLGAAAGRLIGLVTKEQLLDATREELRQVGLSSDKINRNVSIAAEVFDQLEPIGGIGEQVATHVGNGAIAAVEHHSPVFSTPSILAAGNTEARDTGSWRVERPEIDYERCTRCGICFVRCPDGAIALDDDGYPVIDYDHCKGCMVCWDQCPVHGGIQKQKEVRAW